jgi:ubiquinone/menaquinone biosynthesis C-methylase UbiE
MNDIFTCQPISEQDGILIFTDDPNLAIDDDKADKYIGYEHIGENYSGKHRYEIEENGRLMANEASQLCGEGVLFDLCCGDGYITVPAAANETRIVAADISLEMMLVLKKRALYNEINLDNATLCRMNALKLPIIDSVFTVAVCNSALHLMSNPQKVLLELYRTIIPGGFYITQDDRAVRGMDNKQPFDNNEYLAAVNTIYNAYWDHLKAVNVYPRKYAWNFDILEFCDKLFSTSEQKIIRRGEEFSRRLEDGFLPRFCARGFSDQAAVPQKLHEKALAAASHEAVAMHGADYGKLPFRGYEDDIALTIYRK